MSGIIPITLIILLFIAAIFTIAAVIRVCRFKPRQVKAVGDYMPSDDTAAAEKLSEAVRIKTISHLNEADNDWEAFRSFHTLLEKQFPLVHSSCEKITVNQYSLVYCLKAKNKNASREPVLITAHMDVVPVEEETIKAWEQPPFGGDIAGGFVWGRGTLDTKVHLIAALEALEQMIAADYPIERDIYLAFGHDEEINGDQGAVKIANYFKKQGLHFDFVLDEGGCVTANLISGLEKPVAMIGVGEKGYANIRLKAECDGGHSSMPSRHTSMGIIAEALYRLEKHQMKARLIKPAREFLMQIGPHMKGVKRIVLANLWLFKPLFLFLFSKTNSGNAMLRTTIAVTMAQGGPAPNVIPQQSSAIINSRILPGEKGEDLIKHMKKVIKGLPVELEPLILDDPSMISPSNSEAYLRIEQLVGEFCGDALAVPYLVMAATDARKYESVCEHIYRFSPYVIDFSDVERMHGTNERISVRNVNRCVDFFYELMKG